MCGIAGIWDFDESADMGRLKDMRDLLSHRGPDDRGLFVDRNIGLAHRRLSIIDLSKAGKQPMSNEDGSVWIVYNGEVYNFREIREDLIKKGHRFVSDTDTEAIIHAYEEYGSGCLNLFNGMFAFAIWDSGKKELFLARDRLGIKPLYYYWDGKRIIFASEMKAVLAAGISKEIDRDALADYFSGLCIPAPRTILKNVYKMMPGHCMTVKDKALQEKKYWDLEYRERDICMEDAEKELVRRLEEAVRKRMVSDVPIGAFLSGGVDSSAVVALMSRAAGNVKTFSIGFEGQDDELDAARKTAEMHSTDHHEYVVKPAEFSLFPKLVYYADEPFADDSIIPSYIVSDIARKKVTVCLSGDGGDENFAGYERYFKNRIESFYAGIPYFLRRMACDAVPAGRWKRILEIGMISDDAERFARGNEKFTDSEKRDLLNFRFRKTDKMDLLMGRKTDNSLNRMLYLDMKTTLPDLFLKKVDTASMANALEVRVPFLDHGFAEFAASLPAGYKLRRLSGKYILKRAVRRIVPKDVIKGRKTGFSAPVNSWLKGELRGQLHDIVFSAVKRGYFNAGYVRKLWEQHQKDVFDHHERLWSLISFELWSRIYMDGIEYRKALD